MATRQHFFVLIAACVCLCHGAAAATIEAAQHRQLAETAAASQWKDAYRYSCTDQSHSFNNIADAAVRPKMIFDDVAILGDLGTVVFLIKTSRGNILIDSSYSTKTESVLLPSLRQLRVTPDSIKYILLTHGHSDHFGGAKYFQDHFHARIVASAADWELMGHPDQLPPNAEAWMSAVPPLKDIAVGDGDEIVLGHTVIKAYLIPGHTPGALAFIFPVHDHGHAHKAGLFGGTVLGMARLTDDRLRQYVESLRHFAAAARANQVDVELQNHPLFDDTWMKADALVTRRSGEANPFVVGVPAYQSFLTVISECAQATLTDR
jgi:metallo-beta-lactamase class B